jgi:hypothetical protein
LDGAEYGSASHSGHRERQGVADPRKGVHGTLDV